MSFFKVPLRSYEGTPPSQFGPFVLPKRGAFEDKDELARYLATPEFAKIFLPQLDLEQAASLVIICADKIKRDSEKIEGVSHAPFLHTDFYYKLLEEDPDDFLEMFIDSYMTREADQLNAELQNYRVLKTVNIWTLDSLTQGAHPLGFIDPAYALKNLSKIIRLEGRILYGRKLPLISGRLPPLSTVRRILPSFLGFTYPIVWFPELKGGMSIAFDPTYIPHTSLEMPQLKGRRLSHEYRCIYLQEKPETSTLRNPGPSEFSALLLWQS